jgi:1,2-phenylacetyl-CoA epoxidase catalytic subunit
MGHIGFGTNQTAEMALKGGEQQEKIQGSVDFWYIKARDQFRPIGFRTLESLLPLGAKTAEQYSTRWEFKKEVDPLIQQMGLAVPDPITGRQYL